ncbi:antA/AntB antirepressor family protein [Bartonella henselae]|uniref:antA/AntB antirepressor family protein n=1 Tax=Bartonella henselae TaxID=38323 RepID=UPI0009655FD2|nr:antA/AntB antirepressor family protein [Bartonella henselae]OLL54732.1 antirepressor [Bartonella henselae]OLL55422.1 antirepressor [Bartonella henselae]UJM33085.1 antA/AntB antirepressor family protein [Bartonella henselae]
MNTLIEIKEQIIDQEAVQTVNARELHAFMEIGKRFATWITNRINQYAFEEGKDFIKTQDLRFPKLGSAKSRAVTVIEYHLTLDMAKELSMVERNEKGRQARRYFIECEKKLKSQSVEYDVDRRFDLPSHWEGMNAGEKALYLLGPIHVRLIDAFRVDEENRKYKALIKEAKRVLATSVTKAA